MKLSMTRDALHAALTPLHRITPTRTSLPVLANVLIDASADGVALTTTNLEMAMTRRCMAVVHEAGAITVPSATILEYVGALPSGTELTLELDERTRRLAVTGGRSNANIAGIDADDFPPMTLETPTSLMTVPAALLRSAIGDVEFAAAPDISRPVLNGVCLQGRGEAYELAAADGFRLAVRRIERPVGAPSDIVPLIIPGPALRQLARVLPQDETPVAMSLGTQLLRCVVGETTVTTRLVEGQFPDYARIVPAETPLRVTVDRVELLTAVKMARVFSKHSAEITRLSIDTETAQVTVSATGSEIGDGTSAVSLGEVFGDPLDVAFNGRYLVDALERIRSEQVELACAGATTPGLLRPIGPEHDAVLMVVMPMHVASEGRRAA